MSSHGNTWKTARKISEQGFKLKTLELVAVGTQRTAAELFKRWDTTMAAGQGEIPVLADMLKLTMDVLCQAGFSYNPQSVEAISDTDAPIYVAFKKILYGLSQRGMNPLLTLNVI